MSELEPPLTGHIDLHVQRWLAQMIFGGQSSHQKFRWTLDVDRSPPADSPAEDHLITMVPEIVKKVTKNEKQRSQRSVSIIIIDEDVIDHACEDA